MSTASPGKRSPREPASRPLRLLVVEDEPSTAQVLESFLTGLGYRVRVAADVASAMALSRIHRPDVLLTDFLLHGSANGVDLIRQLRAEIAELPVVLMTGFPEMTMQAKLGGLDNVTILLKPMRLSALLAVLEQLTGPAPEGRSGSAAG